MEYDAVVVGAGPAGGSCVSHLSEMGHKVLLIEKSAEIGEPNFSSGGTPTETIKEFNLPKKVIQRSWNSLLIAGPTEKAEFKYNKTMGYVLNYRELKQHLAKKASKNGAEIMVGTTVTEPILNGSNVVGVRYKGINGEGEAHARVVVDASGPQGSLATKLNLRKFNTNGLAHGIEFLMTDLNLRNNRRLEFYLGREYIPGGYAWIFPTGKNEAKVGVAALVGKERAKLIDYLNNFISNNSQTKNGNPIEAHSGSLFASGGIKKHSSNGFLVIGDAAVQINPLGGEGIRHSIYSGRFAAQTIDKAIRNNDFTIKQLSKYDDMWKRYVGNRWKLSAMLQRYVYQFSDNLVDFGVKFCSGMDKRDVFQLLFYYNFKVLMKYKREIFSLNPFKLFKIKPPMSLINQIIGPYQDGSKPL